MRCPPGKKWRCIRICGTVFTAQAEYLVEHSRNNKTTIAFSLSIHSFLILCSYNLQNIIESWRRSVCINLVEKCTQIPKKNAIITLVPQSFMRGRKVNNIDLKNIHDSFHLSLHWLTRWPTGWKCCKPRVLTFDEFLSIPACTTGKHSTTDTPPTIEKKGGGGGDASENPAPAVKPAAAAAPSAPISVPQPATTPPPPPPESEEDDPSLEIPKGKTCKRKACGQSYTGNREGEKCVYHPGAPLFHEGSKGYTCCKKKVLDFDEFLKIKGCKTKDRHLFVGSGDKKR